MRVFNGDVDEAVELRLLHQQPTIIAFALRRLFHDGTDCQPTTTTTTITTAKHEPGDVEPTRYRCQEQQEVEERGILHPLHHRPLAWIVLSEGISSHRHTETDVVVSIRDSIEDIVFVG